MDLGDIDALHEHMDALLDFEVVGHPDPKNIVKQPPSDIKARRS